jgi:hypothetical protein
VCVCGGLFPSVRFLPDAICVPFLAKSLTKFSLLAARVL